MKKQFMTPQFAVAMNGLLNEFVGWFSVNIDDGIVIGKIESFDGDSNLIPMQGKTHEYHLAYGWKPIEESTWVTLSHEKINFHAYYSGVTAAVQTREWDFSLKGQLTNVRGTFFKDDYPFKVKSLLKETYAVPEIH